MEMTQQWPCKLPVDHQNKLRKLDNITNQTDIEQIMQEDFKGGGVSLRWLEICAWHNR